MTFRHCLAVNFSPLLLRLLLAITFVWAGLGKILATDLTVTRENAPELVDMDAVAQSEVAHLLPPDYVPQSQRHDDESQPQVDADDQSAPTHDNNTPPATPGETQDTPPGDNSSDDDFFNTPPPSAMADAPYRTILARQDTSSEPITLKRLYSIGLMLRDATEQHPYPQDSDHAGELMDPILPAFVGKGTTPKMLAWAAALTEIFAGGFMLLGFLTRLSGLALAGVIATAAWLTWIGPAIQSGNTFLGFLPDHSAWAVGVWTYPLWHLALFTVALSVFFSGPGGASLDRLLFGSSGSADDDD